MIKVVFLPIFHDEGLVGKINSTEFWTELSSGNDPVAMIMPSYVAQE